MDKVQEALELWIDITGVDPNANRFSFGDWEIQNINKELKESLTLDNTYITTLMLLDNFATDYLNERHFSVNEMLSDYDKVLKYLEKSKSLYSILKSESIEQRKKEFQDWLIEALKHYKVDNEKVYEMALSTKTLGFLRRDALRSMETLQIHQFYQGNPEKSNMPKYITKVHEFWNINSLIQAMLSDKTMSGISLNLIRDPMDSSSYFAFGIKNGETLSILTDRPNYAHPLQKYMSRRPGRELSDRISKHHFPYDLLNIAYDSKGDAFVKPTDSTELTLYQKELFPMKEIKELEPDEVIWIIMMFSLIKERFWDKNFKTKELTYTGEMVYRKEAITENIHSLTVSNYEKLEISSLSMEDISTEATEEEWDRKSTNSNLWLEQRYEDKINSEILNLLGNTTTVKLLTDSNEVTEVTAKEYEKSKQFMSDIKINGHQLQKLDTSLFGSRKDILQNQKWIARYNKAVAINAETHKEYKARQKEVEATYYQKLIDNQDNLLKAIALGKFEAPVHPYITGGFGYEEHTEMENILKIQTLEARNEDSSIFDLWKTIKLAQERADGHYGCAINGSKATIVARFSPQNAEALALLCGIKKEELPDVLQHWTKAERYGGNPILEKLDPMEWVVENPWNKLKLSFEVFLSKNAYNELRKKQGLEPNKFWLLEQKERSERRS